VINVFTFHISFLRIQLSANAIPVKFRSAGVFQYAVSFSPAVDMLGMRKQIMCKLANIIKDVHAFDGAILFLPFRLAEKVNLLWRGTQNLQHTANTFANIYSLLPHNAGHHSKRQTSNRWSRDHSSDWNGKSHSSGKLCQCLQHHIAQVSFLESIRNTAQFQTNSWCWIHVDLCVCRVFITGPSLYVRPPRYECVWKYVCGLDKARG